MWKIYYALWVEGLSMRTGQGSVALAKGYLESSDGDTWQDQLAKFFVKKISLDQLKKSARNVGQKVEVDYYGAVVALSDGRKDDAEKMLERVISSDLLGFFEYRMARAILKKEFASAPK
jgi:lipoprotein NlpI